MADCDYARTSFRKHLLGLWDGSRLFGSRCRIRSGLKGGDISLISLCDNVHLKLVGLILFAR